VKNITNFCIFLFGERIILSSMNLLRRSTSGEDQEAKPSKRLSEDSSLILDELKAAKRPVSEKHFSLWKEHDNTQVMNALMALYDEGTVGVAYHAGDKVLATSNQTHDFIGRGRPGHEGTVEAFVQSVKGNSTDPPKIVPEYFLVPELPEHQVDPPQEIVRQMGGSALSEDMQATTGRFFRSRH
jgi:hypothetical protein